MSDSLAQSGEAEMEHSGQSRYSGVRKRHEEMVTLVRETGFATIQWLAEHFGVTPQTVRRDINVLAARGMLERYHGGAGPVISTENVDYTDRKILCHAEKQAIGALVARYIPNRSSLFINIGTTNEEVARCLVNHSGLRVITNSLNVAGILSENESMEILVAGGVIRHRDRGVVGESAVDFIRQFRVDYGIIGISGIDRDGTLLDFDYREVRAARAIMENSRNVFLVADHTKFGRNAMVRLGEIHEVDSLFTDASPPPSVFEAMDKGEVRLLVSKTVEVE